jgi:hypothetical protein
MRTSERVYHQISWDPRLDPSRFVVGIDVHAARPKRVPVPDFVPGGDIPWHRVLFYEFDGRPCWDRAGLDELDAIAEAGEAIPRELGPPMWAPRTAVRWHDGWVAVRDEPERRDNLRVLTWNVLWDRYDADRIASHERWPRLLDLAFDSGADLIAFQ